MYIDVIYYVSDVVVRNQVIYILKQFHNLIIKAKSLNELPEMAYNKSRNQYRADYINIWLSRLGKADIKLGVLDIDAYVPGLNFVFGVATPPLKTASVYLPRLRSKEKMELYYKRIRKEVLHELGHLFGLEHCRNYRCVMSFSNSVYEVDLKKDKYCRLHFEMLKEKGLKIEDVLLLNLNNQV